MEATSQAGIIHIATYVSKSLRLINTHRFIKSYDYCVFWDLKTHLETTLYRIPAIEFWGIKNDKWETQ